MDKIAARVVYTCAGIVLAVALLDLVGWILGLDQLKSLLPGYVVMKPNTALAFLVAGIALIVQARGASNIGLYHLGQALGVVAAAIGGLTLVENLFQLDFGVDEILFTDLAARARGALHPGRMSNLASACFVLSGAAIALSRWHRRRVLRPTDLLVLPVAAIAILVALEYVFWRDLIDDSLRSTRLALPSVLGFLGLSLGVVAEQPDGGILGALRARFPNSLERRIYISLALSLLALLATGSAALFSASDSVDRERWSSHTVEVRRQIALVFSLHQDIQTGARGFIITGQPSYVDTTEQAAAESGPAADKLAELVADNPVQEARAQHVADLGRQHVAWDLHLIDLRRTTDAAHATQAIMSGQGKRLMDDMRSATRAMDDEEVRLLTARTKLQELSVERLKITIFLSTLLALIVVAAAAYVIHRDFKRRHRAEAALRASEEGLATLLASIGDGVLACDAEGAVLRMNPVSERLTGWALDDARGRPLTEVMALVNEDARGAFQLPTEAVLADGVARVSSEHIVLVARDATRWPIACTTAPLRGADGAPRGVVVVFRDVSAERQAEQMIRRQNQMLEEHVRRRTAQLRDSEARLAITIESLSEGVIVASVDGVLQNANRAAMNMLGFSRREDYQRALASFADSFELYSGDGRLLALDEWPLSRILKGETLRHLEVGIQSRNEGWTKAFSFSGTLVHDPFGKPLLAVLTMDEITERKNVERRLRRQLEHLNLLDQVTRSIGERQDLHSIFQVVVGAIESSLSIDFSCLMTYDAVGNRLRVGCIGAKSHDFAQETGLAVDMEVEVDGNGLSRCVNGMLVHEPDIGASQFPFPQRLAAAGMRSLVLAPLVAESHAFGVLVAARREAHSFLSSECEFLRQLSEHIALAVHQAQLYGALQQAYEDLRQSQQSVLQQERLRALGQMASGIAHDINNALSPVSLYTELMLEGETQLSPRGRNGLEIIQRAVDDVASTVARLREFYRERGHELDLSPVELNTMARQVLDLTRARWNDMALERGVVIAIHTELAPGLPEVPGVQSEIREALTNLVLNAVDAMPDGGILTLRTGPGRPLAAEGPPSVQIEVIDDGIGMDDDTRRRCLDPFFTTKGERGTGLGLAMVFGVAQRHGAEVEIDSAPGAGTTVRLLFPLPQTPMLGRDAKVLAPPRPPRLRLLLIDDDPVLLRSLRETLEIDGHWIEHANGGAEGIARFREAASSNAPFEAVITDLGMPHVDGRKVAAAIKSIDSTIPIILLSGWGRRLIAEGDTPTHIDRVLAKPPKLRELREALAILTMSHDEDAANDQEPAGRGKQPG